MNTHAIRTGRFLSDAGARPPFLRRSFVALLIGLGTIAVRSAAAQETLRAFGSEGPFPAVHEAARAFERQHGAAIEVVAGPTGKWLDRAAQEADVVFASAEFMMAEFLDTRELQIDAASVTPLYLRRAAILVRPGNPKCILDFPDLLRDGVSVLVVTGSGQTGLWEDVAGKQGDVRSIRALRKNIAYFAAHSDEAMKIWEERQDIDAWLTWDIWLRPLRHRAELVPLSEDYVIYRQCSIALTRRGSDKPVARQFVKYLTSPAGAAIFASWGWITSPVDPMALKVKERICIVCDIKNDDWCGGVGKGLICVQRLIEDYERLGVQRSALRISAVCHGDAAYWMLRDEPYRLFTTQQGHNPNKFIIRRLVESGVSMELCAQAVQEHGWTAEDVLPGVTIVRNAMARVVDLQLQEYAYVGF